MSDTPSDRLLEIERAARAVIDKIAAGGNGAVTTEDYRGFVTDTLWLLAELDKSAALLMDSARAFLTVTRERDQLREQAAIDFEAVDERIRKQSAQIEEQAKRLVTANARLADQDAILAVMPTEEEWARMERDLEAARKVVGAARALADICVGITTGPGQQDAIRKMRHAEVPLRNALIAYDAGNASDQVATSDAEMSRRDIMPSQRQSDSTEMPATKPDSMDLGKIRAAHAYHREIGLRCVICFLLAELEAAEKVRQAQVKQLVERVGTNAATVPSSSLNESGDPVRTTAPARVVRNVDIATKSANPDTARVFATFSEHPPICEQCGPGAWGRSQQRMSERQAAKRRPASRALPGLVRHGHALFRASLRRISDQHKGGLSE